MVRRIHPQAGKRPDPATLMNRQQAEERYNRTPAEGSKVENGTSGHRGVIGVGTTDLHIAAMTQALADETLTNGTFGPKLPPGTPAEYASGSGKKIVMGKDVRYGSDFAQRTAAEVFAANRITVIVEKDGKATPTPVVSHAIVTGNSAGRRLEGTVITASHNPPDNVGYKSNGLDGGPNTKTAPIDERANVYMKDPSGIRRMDYDAAVARGLIIEQDLQGPYVRDLANAVEFDVIRGEKFAASPLGGSAGGYYERINAEHSTRIAEVLGEPDPTCARRTRDWDGKLRGDPSSEYAMKAIEGKREELNVPFIGANDNDADRFGGIDATGILNPNHVLAVLANYLIKNRNFPAHMVLGKTIGTTHMLDEIAAQYGRGIDEVNVGFKYYVKGVFQAKYILAGEESAGLVTPRRDGSLWVTEKDGILAVLLMMEAIARTGKDIGTLYGELVAQHGPHPYQRIDTKAETPEGEAAVARIRDLSKNEAEVRRLLEGKRINGQLVQRIKVGDGIKVVLENRIWTLLRPSGTEPLFKCYMEAPGFENLAEAEKSAEDLKHHLGIAA